MRESRGTGTPIPPSRSCSRAAFSRTSARAGCTHPLSLTSLAADAAVHPVYLARVFRRPLHAVDWLVDVAEPPSIGHAPPGDDHRADRANRAGVWLRRPVTSDATAPSGNRVNPRAGSPRPLRRRSRPVLSDLPHTQGVNQCVRQLYARA